MAGGFGYNVREKRTDKLLSAILLPGLWIGSDDFQAA
jgi:hypothetical protein